MPATLGRIALVSMPEAPDAEPGRPDSGGMGVALRSVALELAALGVQVELLTRAEQDGEVRELAEGVAVRALRAGPRGPVGPGELQPAADEFGEAVAQLAREGTRGYDLIHAHHWVSGLATLPVAIELGIPFVQSFYSLGALVNRVAPAGVAPEPEGRLRAEAFLAQQADAIIASSTAEVDGLLDVVGASADRVWIVPPGVDTSLFVPGETPSRDALRRELGIDDRPVLAVAGRLEPLKGQDLAIRALAELHALRGWAPVLVVAGDAAPGAEDWANGLRSLARDLGVAEDVRFVGALERSTLADLLAIASVALVPSHLETLGLVALEAAASGTPVVGYRSAGTAESIDDGTSGVLLTSRDPREWAIVLGVLLSDAENLAALSAGARAHAEGFPWRATASALLGVYAGLAD